MTTFPTTLAQLLFLQAKGEGRLKIQVRLISTNRGGLSRCTWVEMRAFDEMCNFAGIEPSDLKEAFIADNMSLTVSRDFNLCPHRNDCQGSLDALFLNVFPRASRKIVRHRLNTFDLSEHWA